MGREPSSHPAAICAAGTVAGVPLSELISKCTSGVNTSFTAAQSRQSAAMNSSVSVSTILSFSARTSISFIGPPANHLDATVPRAFPALVRPGPPSAHAPAIGFVLAGKGLSQSRLFVRDDEEVRREQEKAGVGEESGRPIEKRRPCQGKSRADVHGISHPPIWTADHQPPRRIEGSRRPFPHQR